jgi:hypothetical protein
MNKDTARQRLLVLFQATHVMEWLSKFPDTHVFPDTVIGDFVDYINSL